MPLLFFTDAAAIPVLYLIGFACLHSALASLTAKRMARKILGRRLDMIYMPLFSAIAIVTVLPLAYLLYLFPGSTLYTVPSPWRWLMIGMQAVVGLASMRAFIDAPHRFLISAQLTGALDTGDAVDTEDRQLDLGIRGVYCWIRDPFLLSGLLLIWLTPFMTESLLAVYVLTTIYLFIGSLHWESRLIAQFGDAYRQYQHEVPRLIPRGRRCIV